MTLMEEGCTTSNDLMELVKSGNSKALAVLLQTKDTEIDELNIPDKNGRVSKINSWTLPAA